MDIVEARSPATASPPLAADAATALRRAEALAQVTVREPQTMPEIAAATAMWDRIWQADGASRLGPEVLRALTHAGNYLAGAMRGDRLIGALAGFYAKGGELHLHSHILGVDPTVRSAGVGFALKVHQRLWALERGLGRITWTFDPLVSANAYFNLHKLGARGVEYHANFYGAMSDGLNGGDDSDRVLVSWSLDEPRVARACMGERAEARLDGAPYAVRMLPDGAPRVDQRVAQEADRALCALPRDIVAMRHDDPACAAEWRVAVREVLSTAMARGLVLNGVTRDGVCILATTGR
jgi:predicted GNAT superfamily acetyltransferase